MARPNSKEREKADQAFEEWLNLNQYKILTNLPPRVQFKEFEVRAFLYDYLCFYIENKGTVEGINEYMDYETFLSREYHKREGNTVGNYQFTLSQKFRTNRSLDGYVTRLRWGTLTWLNARRNKSIDDEVHKQSQNSTPFGVKLNLRFREAAYVDDEVGGHILLTMTRLEGDDKQIMEEFSAELAKARESQKTDKHIGTKLDSHCLSESNYLALCDLILYAKYNNLVLTNSQIIKHIPDLIGDIKDTVRPRALRLLDPIHLSGLRKLPS